MAEGAGFSILAKTLWSLRRNEKILWQTDGIIHRPFGAFLAEFASRRGLDRELTTRVVMKAGVIAPSA
jgi:hypothetical protein